MFAFALNKIWFIFKFAFAFLATMCKKNSFFEPKKSEFASARIKMPIILLFWPWAANIKKKILVAIKKWILRFILYQRMNNNFEITDYNFMNRCFFIFIKLININIRIKYDLIDEINIVNLDTKTKNACINFYFKQFLKKLRQKHFVLDRWNVHQNKTLSSITLLNLNFFFQKSHDNNFFS